MELDILPIVQFLQCRNKSLVCVCMYREKLITHTERMLISASLQSAAQTDLTQHKVMEEELPAHRQVCTYTLFPQK